MSRYLVVGLGNPGAKYEKTRHNVGFMVLDRLAARHMLSIDSNKFKGRWGDGLIAGERVALLKPQTFMNLSGDSVRRAVDYFDIAPEQIVVVHDELDLDLGAMKVKAGGGHGGHNGLRDIAAKLGTKDFLRVRVGIGRPTRGSVTDWVLGDFRVGDRDDRDEVIERACDAIETILSEGVTQAQNRFNGA